MMCLFNVQNFPNFPGDPSVVALWKVGNWLNWPGENGLSEIILGLYKCNDPLTVKQLKLHSAL